MKQHLDYVKETFTAAEIAVLNKYFTNTDKPVFGLINLPDVVKGALFARYSRSGKSLRRLFLDEFYKGNAEEEVAVSNAGAARAASLYDKMILDFGDDSVAQLGGAHIACEQVSNVLTKILEKGRLAAYLEQSTRYVYYNEKIEGRYNYIVPAEVKGTEAEADYCAYLDSLFETYTEIQQSIVPLLKEKYPRKENQGERAWETTIKAKACDIVRGLLPAATKSNLGIYGNGQFFEMLLVKMFASRNAEVVQYAEMMLEELRKMIPSFLTRVDLEDRGRLWSRYLGNIAQEMKAATASLATPLAPEAICQQDNEVRLTRWDSDGLDRVLSSALFEYTQLPEGAIREHLATLSLEEKTSLLRRYAGQRSNRRHKPGRAFEQTSYTFEVTSDYGAFRDLQRHRILTIEWQKLSPRNGYVLPVELEEYPEMKALYEKALQRVVEVYNAMCSRFGEEIAQYVIPFAYRLRYEITMNLREAFHFIELRSQKQGHISYRKVSIDMYRLISEAAGHPYFAELMKFVDTHFYDLSREDAENAKDKRMAKA